jgi:hypothetical protein
MKSIEMYGFQYEPTKLMLKLYEKVAEAFIVSGLIYQSKRYMRESNVKQTLAQESNTESSEGTFFIN